MPSIDDLLRDRAAAMAEHDGAPTVGAVHIHGAANQLQAEILAARDRQLAPAGASHAPPAEPAAAAEDVSEAPAEAAADAKPAPAAKRKGKAQ